MPATNAFIRFIGFIKGFLYEIVGFDTANFALTTRRKMEHMLMLVTIGDLLGIPIMPSYYSIRFLPYFVSQISAWKKSMLRERDFIDSLF